MIYSDVLKAELILPHKKIYSMRDVKNVITKSLFMPFDGHTIDLETACFIVKCSACFHKTNYTDSINTTLDKLRKYRF